GRAVAAATAAALAPPDPASSNGPASEPTPTLSGGLGPQVDDELRRNVQEALEHQDRLEQQEALEPAEERPQPRRRVRAGDPQPLADRREMDLPGAERRAPALGELDDQPAVAVDALGAPAPGP